MKYYLHELRNGKCTRKGCHYKESWLMRMITKYVVKNKHVICKNQTDEAKW